MQSQYKSENKSTIIESKQILDILAHSSYNTFFVFDLDNTLMESKQELGSDQWIVKLREKTLGLFSSKEVNQLILTLYIAIQDETQVQPVQPEIIQVIKKLQEINMPVLALTARGKPVISSTLNQLESINLSFCSRSGDKQEYVLNNGSKEQPVIYQQGIVFCNGHDKGKCLKTFLNLIKHSPQHIVMVDDNKKHLISVYDLMTQLNKKFTGLRYSFLDNKAAQIDLKKAEAQLYKIKDQLPTEAREAAIKLKLL